MSAQVSAYRKLVRSATDRASVEAFEPEFFNNMVLVLESSFMHRSRTIEKKDGDPLNEVRVLSQSLMENDGEVRVVRAARSDEET